LNSMGFLSLKSLALEFQDIGKVAAKLIARAIKQDYKIARRW